MQHSTKRRRVDGQLSPSPSYHSNQEIDVSEARRANDLKLKSRFESIFEKYEKDFSFVGDEIDLTTGEIVINNGHIRGMRNEQDVGDDIWADFHPDESDDEIEDIGTPAGKGVRDFTTPGDQQCDQREVNQSRNVLEDGKKVEGTHSAQSTAGELVPSNEIDTDARSYIIGRGDGTTNTSRGGESLIDSLWEAPDIDAPFYSPVEPEIIQPTFTEKRTPSPSNSKSLWLPSGMRRPKQSSKVKRKLYKKSKKLQESIKVREGSDSDDPIQDIATPTISRRSPSHYKTPIYSQSTNESPSCTTKKRISPFSDDLPEYHEGPDVEQTVDDASFGNDVDPVPQPLEPEVLITSDNVEGPTELKAENENPVVGQQHSIPVSQPVTIKVTPETFSPQEVKTIMNLRMKKRRPWRDIFAALPSHKPAQLKRWYYIQRTSFKNKSTDSSNPWSRAENEKLASLEFDPPDTWPQALALFEDRNIEELLHEWIRVCIKGRTQQGRRPSAVSEAELPHHQADDISPLYHPAKESPNLRPTFEIVMSSPNLSDSRMQVISVEDTEPQADKEESPDPLTEAFEDAWLGSGLSTLQVNTPPKPLRSPKKNILAKARNSPLAPRRHGK